MFPNNNHDKAMLDITSWEISRGSKTHGVNHSTCADWRRNPDELKMAAGVLHRVWVKINPPQNPQVSMYHIYQGAILGTYF